MTRPRRPEDRRWPTPRWAPPDGGTSLTLLDRLRTGDQDAWGRLVYLYGPLVRHWAGRRGVAGADADDVAQEVFQEVSGALDGFQRGGAGGSFRGWLHGVTRHVLLRHAERTARHPPAAGGTVALLALQAVPGGDPTPDPADAPAAELAALYRRGLELVRAEFEPRTWQMFWAVAVDGRATADVAADLGVTAAAVRQARSRVLRRLREELGDLTE